jgi:hypothetical protein
MLNISHKGCFVLTLSKVECNYSAFSTRHITSVLHCVYEYKTNCNYLTKNIPGIKQYSCHDRQIHRHDHWIFFPLVDGSEIHYKLVQQSKSKRYVPFDQGLPISSEGAR